MRYTLIPALLMAPAAFADPLFETRTPEMLHSEMITQWQGEAPHIIVQGTVGEYTFDLQVTNFSADYVAEVVAKREYLLEGDSLRYADFEFGLSALLAEVEKQFELEFENHNFFDHKLPATYELQAEEFPEGSLSNLEFEYEWEIGDTTVNEEVVEWSGTLTVHHDDGLATPGELSDSGMIGGFVSAQKGKDKLVVSFMVPVNEAEIDD